MERLRGLLFGAMIGDAYALPAHWIYDTEKIATGFKNYQDYLPISNHMFHNNKPKGSQTHYGDQALLLLRSIASTNGFDLNQYRTHWLTYMSQYQGYIDHATKESLTRLSSGGNTGSSSDDLGGFTMCVPLIVQHFDDDHLFDFLKKALKLTHDDETLLLHATFMTKVILELIIGKPLVKAIYHVAKQDPEYQALLDFTLRFISEDEVEAIKAIGQSCSCDFATPSALLIILNHPNDFEAAMKINLLAGGDSAARGMLIGMLLGAEMGIGHLPEHLVAHLQCRDLLNAFTDHKRI
jgi:ADP-ribosylglycohydrolase